MSIKTFTRSRHGKFDCSPPKQQSTIIADGEENTGSPAFSWRRRKKCSLSVKYIRQILSIQRPARSWGFFVKIPGPHAAYATTEASLRIRRVCQSQGEKFAVGLRSGTKTGTKSEWRSEGESERVAPAHSPFISPRFIARLLLFNAKFNANAHTAAPKTISCPPH